MTMPTMALERSIEPGRPSPVLLFTCEPVLDAGAASRAIAAFRNLWGVRPIVWLDLSAVQRVSRAGVAVLSRFVEGAGSRAAALRLIGVPPAIRARLRGTSLESHFWEPPPSFPGGRLPAA